MRSSVGVVGRAAISSNNGVKPPFGIRMSSGSLELKLKRNGIFRIRVRVRVRVLRAMLDSSSDNFAKRIEQAWSISQQPTPIACSSCNTNGYSECKWCAGTGFFIIGDNMLCEVPSRNTTCVVCAGEGSTRCNDCQGTGFRAKWLGKSQVNEE